MGFVEGDSKHEEKIERKERCTSGKEKDEKEEKMGQVMTSLEK